ncbi:MAG TPA: c-type cytochrome biogenesis protein CcmI [Burkholderiales bacterium]|nr:c-type cytochrome biogenesis protein CcmI [Burkholderiales bacterium]
MTAFWIIAVLLAAGALAFLLPPLLARRGAAGAGTRAAANVAVYRDQLRELEADLAAGTLSRAQYDEARREIESRLLEDLAAEQQPAPAPRAGREAAIALGVAVPLVAALLYLAVGNPRALSPQAEGGGAHAITAQQIEELVGKLAARLRANPEDATGWMVLGRSYTVLGRFAEAADAYANAVRRLPPDAQLLADYADALAMAQGRSLAGEPERVIAQALAVDPNNVKALALAGTAAFQKRDYGAAAAHWEKILNLVPADSEFAAAVRASLSEARSAGGATAPSAPATRPAVSGTVRLAPELAAKVSPDDTVFVFARAAEGSRLPLAVTRKRVRDLPAAFSLDDSMGMAAGAKLSDHARVIVGARVSKSGDPAPRPGDLEGLSAPVRVGEGGVTVVIDSEIR